MTTHLPKTKEEILNSISNEIVEKYLEDTSGLCNFSAREFNEYLKKSDINKSGNYAMFHYIQALIYTAQHKYEDALYKYKAALSISPNNVTILNNYTTLLIDLNYYDEAFKIVNKLLDLYRLNGDATVNSLIRLSIRTLNVSYLDKVFSKDSVFSITQEMLELYEQIFNLCNDIQLIGISNKEYTEYFEFLSEFILKETNQTFHPRFSIDNALDKQLNIEIFLKVNAEEASYLNTEFRNKYLDYVFDNDRHDLLGKFVVFFRQSKNRQDGTENPEALYLGMNKELVA